MGWGMKRVSSLTVFFFALSLSAAPQVKTQSCDAKLKLYNTKTKKPVPARDSDYNYTGYVLSWLDGNQEFAISNEIQKFHGGGSFRVSQTLKTSLPEPRPGVSSIYIDEKIFGRVGGKIISAKASRQNEIEWSSDRNSWIVTNVTPGSGAQPKVYHTQVSNADGATAVLVEQRDPAPVGEDGIQRLSYQLSCKDRPIPAHDAKYSGNFRIKSQVESFDGMHARVLAARVVLRACLETGAECSLQKAETERLDRERAGLWASLLKASDFAESDGGGGGGGGNKCTARAACIASAHNQQLRCKMAGNSGIYCQEEYLSDVADCKRWYPCS